MTIFGPTAPPYETVVENRLRLGPPDKEENGNEKGNEPGEGKGQNKEGKKEAPCMVEERTSKSNIIHSILRIFVEYFRFCLKTHFISQSGTILVFFFKRDSFGVNNIVLTK